MHNAGLYRGELLGLVTLHTLIVAVAKHFQLATAVEKICCNNISALGQAGKAQKRVSAGMKHLDLHHAICMLKCTSRLDMKYYHIHTNQGRIIPWSMLTLEQKLNIICNGLANNAIARYLAHDRVRDNGPHFLPLEKAAVVLDGFKLTTDVGPEVRIQLGMEEAERFYTKPCNIVFGVNKRGLGWSSQRFHAVTWKALDATLKSKLDMFQIWLSKQCIGMCATKKNMKRIQDLLDNKCPNCNHPRETSDHLPKARQTLLFQDSMATLTGWMNNHNQTDAELAYWIEKYLIFWGTWSLTSLVNAGGGAPHKYSLQRPACILTGGQSFSTEKPPRELPYSGSTLCPKPMQDHRYRLDEVASDPPHTHLPLTVDPVGLYSAQQATRIFTSAAM